MKNQYSIIQLYLDSIKQNWEQPALSDFMGKDYLYKDAAAVFAYQHQLFKEMGIEPGDRVALCSTNSSKWALSFMSVLLYGAIPVPILPDFMPEQIHHIINHSEVKLLIVSKSIYGRLEDCQMLGLKALLTFEDILNGTYHTGDIGGMNEKGNITIGGRKKNMPQGPSRQNIYPEEIEDKLNYMLFVMESLVVQRKKNLMALAVPNYEKASELNLTDANIEAIMKLNLEELNELIPAYERVSSMEVRMGKFEKTPKKSIKRYLYK